VDENKLLQAVAVSMYVKEIRPVLEQSLPLLDGDSSRLLCAIAADADKTTATYLHNIETARKFHTMGQITWYSDDAIDDLAALKRGPYHDAVTGPFVPK
jgi:hypothetical protein